MLASGARYVCEARRVHSQMPDTINSPAALGKTANLVQIGHFIRWRAAALR
jgi:hypothetical protein